MPRIGSLLRSVVISIPVGVTFVDVFGYVAKASGNVVMVKELVFIYLRSDTAGVRLGNVWLGWVRLGFYAICYTYIC